MIDVCISYGFGEGNRFAQETIPDKIQLAIYKYDIFMELKDDAFKALNEHGTDVKVVHLPLDTLRRELSDIDKLIEVCIYETGCRTFVIHPNKNIFQFIDHFIERWGYDNTAKLLIETFGWRSKKQLRGPLDILQVCIENPELEMVIDTSHIETLWFDHKIMPTLLKYTPVIHLSNRAKGFGSHMPFNSANGELKLVGFVRDLKYRYNWNGDIVLEYMPEHKDKLMKNKKYLERLLA
ncbi:MAG: hypothetical protein ACTSX1_06640 [Candidatus Heimdallarchaeaceae archaeon]